MRRIFQKYGGLVSGAALWLAVCPALSADQSVSLGWDPSPTPQLAGYATYYGIASGAYDSRLDVGTNTTAMVTGLTGGQTYFFAVTAYDGDGAESDPSNEISFDIPGVADLAISITAAPLVLNVGGNVIYTIEVTNAGPDTASGVMVTNTLPAGETFVDATASEGSFTNNNGEVTFALGSIPSGAGATLTVIATAVSAGTLTNSAAVFAGTNDLNNNNNVASASVLVNTVLPVQADYTVNELTLLTFTKSAADLNLPPGLTSFALSNAPPGAIIDMWSGVFTWTPGEAQGPSTNFITLVASVITLPNFTSFIASKTFTVIVNEVNSPPILPTQSNRTICGLAMLMVTNRATDPDIPLNSLTYQLNNPPAGATIDNNGVITWTPMAAQVPSTNVFTAVVTDYNPWAVNAQHLSATNSFVVTVNSVHNGPVLAPVANRTIHAGSLLTVSISATDTDIPTNTLAFSLDAGAPAGATINATNGLFSWATRDADANATNSITVRVTDDGSPNLSSTTSFAVTLVSRPAFRSILRSNDVAVLTWSAIAGQTYRVQYQESLSDTNWNELLPEVSASGPTATATDAASSVGQRFYRVVLVP